MAHTTRSEALEHVCPSCGAQSDEKCVGARGRKRESVHRERLNVAAAALGHQPVHTFRVDGSRLLDEDGNVVGRVHGIEIDVQPEGEWGNLRRGVEEEAVAVDVPSNPQEEPTNGGVGEEQASGQLFEHDPVKEVFEHYCKTVPGKANSRLSQETRRLIKRALDERPIDQLKLAINGLAVSQHHIDGGWTAIKYAIGKTKVSESVGDRIDMMAAKAPAQSNSSDGRVTVEDLLRTVPSDRHWIIRDRMSLVIQSSRRGGRDEGSEEQLRKVGIAPVRDEEGKVTGWRRAS